MVSRLSSTALRANPVTVEEFRSSLISIWNLAGRASQPLTAGLAISGGVDSMALASLCAKLQSPNSRDWRFRAFIVDHSARPGSAEEATAVSKVLMEKGLETSILKIQWPGGVAPHDAPNFETLARRHRYRILGRACRDFKLSNLILGHHADDQAETVLMRLAYGHMGLGLAGMKAKCLLPDCYEIYGVNNSGGVVRDPLEPELLDRPNDFDAAWEAARRSPNPERLHTQIRRRSKKSWPQIALGPLKMEQGGVRILRPLLKVNKDRLRATCVEDDMKWFEDHTNADPTFTQRNAVRYLLTERKMPAALQTKSLVALTEQMAARKAGLKEGAKKLLNKCLVRFFEPRVGSLVVRFPNLASPAVITSQPGAIAVTPHYIRAVANMVIKQALESVSPSAHTEVVAMGSARAAIFPELEVGYQHDNPPPPPKPFTIGGVLFSRLEKPQTASSAMGQNANDAALTTASRVEAKLWNPEFDHPTIDLISHEWSLTRQPFSKRPQTNHNHGHTLDLPPSTSPFPSPLLSSSSTPFTLYDNRYWIRATNKTAHQMRIRHLQKPDLQAFDSTLDPKTRREFLRLLKVWARGDVRFTLPAVVVVVPPKESEREDAGVADPEAASENGAGGQDGAVELDRAVDARATPLDDPANNNDANADNAITAARRERKQMKRAMKQNLNLKASRQKQGQEGEKEQVLLLPTLGIGVPDWDRLVDVEVRYKFVEWPAYGR